MSKLFADIRKRVEDALYSRIELIPFHECWEWIGAKQAKGYGYFRINGKQLKAHRASYMLHYGEIGEGLMVCHKCDNPGCVNPRHIYAGTAQDNVNDIWKRSRKKLVLFCPRGHKKDRLNHRGHGECSICQKEADMKSYYKARVASLEGE